jgi:hypothetical protein
MRKRKRKTPNNQFEDAPPKKDEYTSIDRICGKIIPA